MVIGLLGWWAVIRYRLGLLSLEEALAKLSKRLGLRIRAVILGSATFDPVARVLASSVTVGPTGTEAIVTGCVAVDYNGDGRTDLACVLDGKAAGFSKTATGGALYGATLDGVFFKGSADFTP